MMEVYNSIFRSEFRAAILQYFIYLREYGFGLRGQHPFRKYLYSCGRYRYIFRVRRVTQKAVETEFVSSFNTASCSNCKGY